MAFTISSPAFKEGAAVPQQFTCDGNDTAPPIRVSDPPQGTKSFAIVLDDPDAPRGTFTHWVAFDVPSGTNELNTAAARSLPNGFGREGYGGPCPPRGDRAHRYMLNVYALDVAHLPLSGETRQDLEKALEQHTLANARISGTYARE